jgi:hypothetical protein
MDNVIAPTSEIVTQTQQVAGATVTNAAHETEPRDRRPTTPSSSSDESIEIVHRTPARAAGKATASGEKAPAANKLPEKTPKILMHMTIEEGFRTLIAAMNEQRDLLYAQNKRLERLERDRRRSPSPYRRRRNSPTPPLPQDHSPMPQQRGRHQFQYEVAARLQQAMKKRQWGRVVAIRDSRIPSPHKSRLVGGTSATAEPARREKQKETYLSPPRRRSSYRSPPYVSALLDTEAHTALLLVSLIALLDT